MPKSKEIYISTVVEVEGPIPGPYSMIGLGAIAVDPGGSKLGSFERYFFSLPDTSVHPVNKAYWERPKNVDLYQFMRERAEEPLDAMSDFTTWVGQFDGAPILAGYNASYTWMWVHWYCTKYSNCSPFGLGPLDLKAQLTYFVDMPFSKLKKSDIPESWRSEGSGLDTVKSKAEKQTFILRSLINAQRALQSEFDIPAWTRERFGLSVAEAKRRQHRRAKLAST